MKKIVCDRCGGQISARPVHISVYGNKDIAKKYREVLCKSDFCTECIEFITDFALNKDACDECMREMEENTAMQRAVDEEEGSDSLEEPDPDGIDWGVALERMQKNPPSIKYMVPREVIVNAMKSIRKDFQCQSGQFQEGVRAEKSDTLA